MKKSDEAKLPFTTLLYLTWRTLNDSLKAARLETALLYLVIFIAFLLPYLNDYIVSRVIDELAFAISTNQVEIPILLIATYIAVSLVVKATQSFVSFFERMQHFKTTRYFKSKLAKKLSSLDIYSYESPQKHDLINKVTESDWRPQATASSLPDLIAGGLQIILMSTILVSFSLPLYLVVLLTAIPAFWVGIRNAKNSWGIWDADTNVRRKYFDALGSLSSERPLMELKIFRTKDYLLNLAFSIFDEFFNRERRVAIKNMLLSTSAYIFSVVGVIIFWLVALDSTLKSEISIGQFTFFSSIAARISEAIYDNIVRATRHYENCLYLNDFYQLLDSENTIKNGETRLKSPEPTIEFRNVSFMYPDSDKLVLNKFNLKIHPGEHVALVGENGAGKTTIMKLLCRFYDVTDGQILIDGIDIKDLEIESWYDRIGILFQDFVRYHYLSVKENIYLGDLNEINNEPKMLEASVKAGADGFVQELPDKYDQILSKHFEGGLDISGGQWQRVALARAFFRNAPVLILDEPTSAIDAQGEYEIFENIFKNAANKSILIVSHRYSTVRKANRIIVLEDGQIAEDGSHQDLLKSGGKYAHAYNLQAEGYRD